MGLPKAAEARLFYRAAKQRSVDAEMLLEAGRTTGAVYLAGYTVECYLKALVLAGVAAALRRQILGTFRGSRAHDVEWLRDLVHQHMAGGVPRDVTRHLARGAAWRNGVRDENGVC